MNKTTVLTLLALCGVLLIVAAGTFYVHTSTNDKKNSEAQQLLKATETQVYTDLEGRPFSFDSFEGKVRIVNSWASWSPLSQQELQDLDRVAQEFSAEEVAVIAVNRKEDTFQAKSFVSTLGDLSHVSFAVDKTDAFYISTGGYAMPETVVFDRRGNIVFHKRGNMNIDEIRENIHRALDVQN